MMKPTRTKRGQGIVEYTFVIAFVGILIALAFNLGHGSLFSGISGAYSDCTGALSQLNQTANKPGGGL